MDYTIDDNINYLEDPETNYKTGYIALYRSVRSLPFYPKKRKFTEYEAWIDLLMTVTHTTYKTKHGNSNVIIEAGQIFTSTSFFANRWNWGTKRTYNFFDYLSSEKMITLKRGNKGTLITIVNWVKYQSNTKNIDRLGETKGKQKGNKSESKGNNTRMYNNVNNEEEQQDTLFADSNESTVPIKNIDSIKMVIQYLNDTLGTRYRHTTKENQELINARFKEGNTVQDFKTVIDKKYAEWNGTEMSKHLCIDTLFGTKFEKYLNQKTKVDIDEPRKLNPNNGF